MGQHHRNPTVIALKNGEKLPPKPKKMTKSEVDRMLYGAVNAMLRAPLAGAGIRNYYGKY